MKCDTCHGAYYADISPLSVLFRSKIHQIFLFLLEPVHMGCHNFSICLIYCSMYFALEKRHFHLIVLTYSVCDATKDKKYYQVFCCLKEAFKCYMQVSHLWL